MRAVGAAQGARVLPPVTPRGAGDPSTEARAIGVVLEPLDEDLPTPHMTNRCSICRSACAAVVTRVSSRSGEAQGNRETFSTTVS
jgi:hypothetical protein